MEGKNVQHSSALFPTRDKLIESQLKENCNDASVQRVKDITSLPPAKVNGAKDLMENNSECVWIRTGRKTTGKGKIRITRKSGGGTWRSKNKPEYITTASGIKSKKIILYYWEDNKMTDWVMEEYVLDRGKDVFEEFALCKIRLKRTALAKKKRAEEKGSDGDHGHGSQGELELPLPNESCSTVLFEPLPQIDECDQNGLNGEEGTKMDLVTSADESIPPLSPFETLLAIMDTEETRASLAGIYEW